MASLSNKESNLSKNDFLFGIMMLLLGHQNSFSVIWKPQSKMKLNRANEETLCVIQTYHDSPLGKVKF